MQSYSLIISNDTEMVMRGSKELLPQREALQPKLEQAMPSPADRRQEP